MSVRSVKNLIDYLKSCADSSVSQTHYKVFGADYGPTTFSISFMYQGQKITGWGTDEDKDLAALKALMECLERLVSLDYFPYTYKKSFFGKRVYLRDLFTLIKENSQKFALQTTSNGFALHTNTRLAKNNALYEIVERHTLLSLSSSNIPLQKIETENTFLKSIKTHVPKLLLYKAEVIKGFPVVICDLRGEKNRFLRFGCSNDIDNAVKKALYELCPVLPILDTYSPSHEPDLSTTKGINDYYCLNQKTEFDKKLHAANSDDNKSKLNQACQKPLPAVYYGDLSECHHLKALLNAKGAFAISPGLQPLFFGPWDKKYVNSNALSLTSLPEEPHIVC